jgi:hypothetical protein
LEPSDIPVGKVCPVLGVAFKRGVNGSAIDTSPTIDRIDNSKGYVKGNVVVVSYLANRIKSSANAEQLGKVYRWLKRLTKHQS